MIHSIIDYRNLFTLVFYISLGKIVYFALCKQGRINRALIMVSNESDFLSLQCSLFITAPQIFYPYNAASL